MKIISWNVNGLRAAWGHGLPEFIEKQKADIYAFQETKVHAPFKPAEVSGYLAYWSFSKSKKGYSGTLCLTRSLPLSVSYTGIVWSYTLGRNAGYLYDGYKGVKAERIWKFCRGHETTETGMGTNPVRYGRGRRRINPLP